MVEFGINVDPGHWSNDPAQAMRLLKRTGAGWTRTVLKTNDNASLTQTYFEACIANGIKELGIVGHESCGFSEHPSRQEFREGIYELLDLYKNQIDIWQIGNQPDNPAPDSWTQDEATTEMMLDEANSIIPVGQGLICAPALVTGQPYYIDSLNITYRAANIYSSALNYNGYTFTGVDNSDPTLTLITEYPGNSLALGHKIVGVGGIEIVFVFCLSNRMYSGLGLYDIRDRLLPRGRKFAKLVQDNS